MSTMGLMRGGILVLLMMTCSYFSWSQRIPIDTSSVYNVRWKRDIWVGVGGIALTGAGQFFAFRKDTPTVEYINDLDPSKINRWDRGAIDKYSLTARRISDVLLIGSVLAPMALLADRNMRADWWKLGLLYFSSFAYTTGIFSQAVGHADRPRPYAYNPDAPLEEKLRDDIFNSFYAGHPAVGGGMMFFMARVYQDYYPYRKGMHAMMYSLASATTLALAYCRLEAGRHFVTDNIVGVMMAPITGLLIPLIYKNRYRMPCWTFTPMGGSINGLSMTYTIGAKKKALPMRTFQERMMDQAGQNAFRGLERIGGEDR